jgi:flagellar hook protein FlgE
MSFYTSLSGLRAAQTDMSAISHNLANVTTNGFKKSRAEFADVIASSLDQSPTMMIGSGSVTKAIRQQFSQGNLNQTGSSLDLAIAGDGFFAVKPNQDGSQVNFTRNGSFMVDNDRYVTDAQGAKVQVFPVDGSGAVIASGLDQTIALRLPATSGTPVATAATALNVNLSANAAVKTGAFDRFDPASYNQTTQTTIYDASGNALTMTQYFVRTQAAGGGTPTSEWQVHSFVGDTQLGTDAANPQPIVLEFDVNGVMTSPTGPTQFAAVGLGGSTIEQALSLDLTGSTQLAQAFNVNARSQDGAAVGQLQGVTVDSDGTVFASFSNGESQALGKVVLANFPNPSGLRQLGNSSWAATGLSGEVSLGSPGEKGLGSLMSSMLEGSNVDMTEELVGLIAAQRAFQANAKALDTSSQISQSILNIRA